MNIFAITHRGQEFLDTPVFHAGPDGDDEAIAAFTDREIAEKYLADCDLTGRYEVAELSPIQMLRWFAIARDEGTNIVAIDLNWNAHLAGQRQRVIDLQKPLDACAETMCSEILAASVSDE